ncbi:MAG: hypothetical protein R3E76_02565 [Planctomycetota bacterium]
MGERQEDNPAILFIHGLVGAGLLFLFLFGPASHLSERMSVTLSVQYRSFMTIHDAIRTLLFVFMAFLPAVAVRRQNVSLSIASAAAVAYASVATVGLVGEPILLQPFDGWHLSDTLIRSLPAFCAVAYTSMLLALAEFVPKRWREYAIALAAVLGAWALKWCTLSVVSQLWYAMKSSGDWLHSTAQFVAAGLACTFILLRCGLPWVISTLLKAIRGTPG